MIFFQKNQTTKSAPKGPTISLTTTPCPIETEIYFNKIGITVRSSSTKTKSAKSANAPIIGFQTESSFHPFPKRSFFQRKNDIKRLFVSSKRNFVRVIVRLLIQTTKSRRLLYKLGAAMLRFQEFLIEKSRSL